MFIDSTCSTKDFFSRLLSLLKSRRYAKKSNDDFAAKYHIMTPFICEIVIFSGKIVRENVFF